MLSCNLDEIVTNVLLPFVEHCTRNSDEDEGLEGGRPKACLGDKLPEPDWEESDDDSKQGEEGKEGKGGGKPPLITVITKGNASGIEQQPAGSNVCAFAATVFLGKAISLAFALYVEGGKDADISTPLSEGLRALKVPAKEYEGKRRQAKGDLYRLREAYLQHIKEQTEKEEEMMEEEEEGEDEWEEAEAAGAGKMGGDETDESDGEAGDESMAEDGDESVSDSD